DLPARTPGTLEQPPDRLEVESVGLKLLDQIDPLHVVIAVEARPPPHGRGRHQASRLMRADVPHRHPGAPSKLVDRHRGAAARSVPAHFLVCDVGHRTHGTSANVSSNDVTLTHAWVYA